MAGLRCSFEQREWTKYFLKKTKETDFENSVSEKASDRLVSVLLL